MDIADTQVSIEAELAEKGKKGVARPDKGIGLANPELVNDEEIVTHEGLHHVQQEGGSKPEDKEKEGLSGQEPKADEKKQAGTAAGRGEMQASGEVQPPSKPEKTPSSAPPTSEKAPTEEGPEAQLDPEAEVVANTPKVMRGEQVELQAASGVMFGDTVNDLEVTKQVDEMRELLRAEFAEKLEAEKNAMMEASGVLEERYIEAQNRIKNSMPVAKSPADASQTLRALNQYTVQSRRLKQDYESKAKMRQERVEALNQCFEDFEAMALEALKSAHSVDELVRAAEMMDNYLNAIVLRNPTEHEYPYFQSSPRDGIALAYEHFLFCGPGLSPTDQEGEGSWWGKDTQKKEENSMNFKMVDSEIADEKQIEIFDEDSLDVTNGELSIHKNVLISGGSSDDQEKRSFGFQYKGDKPERFSLIQFTWREISFELENGEIVYRRKRREVDRDFYWFL